MKRLGKDEKKHTYTLLNRIIIYILLVYTCVYILNSLKITLSKYYK